MKICDKCSVANDDAAVFCTGCGAVLPNDNAQETQENQVNQTSAEMNAPQPQQQSYSQPQSTYSQQGPVYSQMQPPYVQPVGSQPAYSQPYGYAPINENMLPEEYKPVTIWQYIGYSILFAVPVIGFIMLLVTAFGSDKSKSLRNFAKAQLILLAIVIVLYIILFIFAGSIIGELGYYY
ncbi:MAG: hypothetical protein J1F24_00520 [Oscillospiraceae bacterium]|nr:hypothetical protein [Oscillospiraceae bacterium]